MSKHKSYKGNEILKVAGIIITLYYELLVLKDKHLRIFELGIGTCN